MAKDTSEKVMKLVEEALKKKPSASVDELYEKAKAADKSIGKLSKRQFHARYPLQIKRRKSRKTSKGRKKSKSRTSTKKRSKAGTSKKAKKTTAGSGREAMRETFMAFASDMAAAEDRKELVQFLAGVDKYVDRAIKAASK